MPPKDTRLTLTKGDDRSHRDELAYLDLCGRALSRVDAALEEGDNEAATFGLREARAALNRARTELAPRDDSEEGDEPGEVERSVSALARLPSRTSRPARFRSRLRFSRRIPR